MLRLGLAIVLLGAAAIAMAQGTPPVDCRRASTTVDKTIFGNAELQADERKMEAAVRRLKAWRRA